MGERQTLEILSSICKINAKWKVAIAYGFGAQLGHLFNCRSRSRSALTGLFSNGFVWGAVAMVVGLQLLAVWWQPLARLLHTVVPNSMDWGIITLAVLAPVVIVEITKFIARRPGRYGDQEQA